MGGLRRRAVTLGVPLLAVVFLAACAGSDKVISPTQSGGSKADGVVSMSSTVSLFHPFEPDWLMAHEGAAKRCSRWGYKAPPTFTGTREFCQAWDKHGRCMEAQLTRYYQCNS
ncbi:MAG: YecR family lipoprotein [Pseudomonadota bacterium]